MKQYHQKYKTCMCTALHLFLKFDVKGDSADHSSECLVTMSCANISKLFYLSMKIIYYFKANQSWPTILLTLLQYTDRQRTFPQDGYSGSKIKILQSILLQIEGSHCDSRV